MALPNNDTVTSLIERAEKKAAELSDIATFDFVEYLENGGVVMPTEQVTLFTDAATSQKILKLYDKHQEVLKAATQKAQAELEQVRDARFQELLAETDQSQWQDGHPPDDSEDDVFGLADGDVLYREVELQKLWQRVFDEFPAADVKEIKDAVDYLNEIERLEKIVWEGRIVVDLEGQQPGDNRRMEQSIADELERKDQAVMSAEQKVEYAAQRRASEMIAACIVRVQIPTKGIDRDLSKERMPASAARRFINTLPSSEVTKLMDAVQMLTTAAVIVDPLVDAGFPGRHSEPTGERAPESGDQDGGDVQA